MVCTACGYTFVDPAEVWNALPAKTFEKCNRNMLRLGLGFMALGTSVRMSQVEKELCGVK